MSNPLWQWSATSLAKAICEKDVSSREAVQAHLDRIDAVNHKVNAVTVVLAEAALLGAAEADQEIAAGKRVGPLHGVPITLKENIDLVGSATTHGIVSLKDSMPEADAPIVAHLKRAGALVIGRTNQPDFGMRWHTANDLRGATLNPWDPSRTPGGSSGGEAAAIATGLSPLGIGNDMGGSLRYPAHCCGISALKPGLGRISRTATAIFDDPPMLYEQIAAVNGPMARHVADLRLALEVMSQPDPGDPWWTPAPPLDREWPRPISVAVASSLSPLIADAVRKAADALADAGYAVDEVDPPLVAEASRALEQIANMETKHYLPEMLPMISKDGAGVIERIVEDTVPDLTAYMTAIAERYRIAQAWSLFMVDHPLVLGPVSTEQAFEVGTDLAGREALRRIIRSLELTEACNLLGLPSVALPVQVTDGLPQGVQLIAPRFHEELCLDAAEAIERRQGVVTPIEPREARGGT